MTTLTKEQREAIEYARQVIFQVECGDGTFVGQCAEAREGLDKLLAAPSADCARWHAYRLCQVDKKAADIASNLEYDKPLIYPVTHDQVDAHADKIVVALRNAGFDV